MVLLHVIADSTHELLVEADHPGMTIELLDMAVVEAGGPSSV